jgi:hypothetical protein
VHCHVGYSTRDDRMVFLGLASDVRLLYAVLVSTSSMLDTMSRSSSKVRDMNK